MKLAGEIALVTGAGGGIGAGIAEALAEAGAQVVLADVNLAWAEAEAMRIGNGASALAIEVTDPASWASARADIEARHGPISILVNNAGISTPRMALDEMPDDLFARLLAINVTGVFNGIKAFVPGMKARASGHVVNVSSMNGLIPFGSFTSYSASKFAVAGLSEGLAQELAPHGVGVSILYPGLTRSRMATDEKDGVGSSPEMLALMMEPLWLGRAVVRAIESNTLHIITHPDHLPALQARLDLLTGSFGEPAQPGYGGGRTV